MAVCEYKSAVDFLRTSVVRERDCLILDLHLPVMSGLDLIDIMQERGLRLPVVFITGRGDKETRQRAMKAGAVAFLEKPVREEPLMEAVCSALTSAATCKAYGGTHAATSINAGPEPLAQWPS
jgi:two-component system response regulator FixJ